VFGRIRHVKVSASKIQIILEGARNDKRPIEIPWAAPTPKGHGHIQLASSETNADPKLLKAIVRAQHWLKQLSNGQSSSIEDLATAAGYNPRVIRQGLRLAFLAPEVAAAALDDELSWVIGMLLTALANYSSNNSRKSLIRSNGFALRLPI
jgi:site-specific DNA recombinase